MMWLVSGAAYDAAIARAESAERHVAQQQHNLEKMREMYDALLDKYHALRTAGANPAPTYSTPAVPDQFGPLTRAALADMSVGQTGPLKRAMRAKAESLWAEQRGQQNQDEVVAIAVRRGETHR